MNKQTSDGGLFFRLPVILFLFFFSLSFNTNAEIIFSDLDLSPDNRLLFRAASGGSFPAEDALFMARPEDGQSRSFSVRQLTAFPERMDILENGRVLQIRGAFGAFRVPLSGGLPAPVPGFPSFAGGDLLSGGRSGEMSPSADGRLLLYLEPESPARGKLVMLDLLSGEKNQIASGIERPDSVFPAVWSPDSRFFLYERAGKLYYYMPGSQAMPEGEKIRLVGEGTVNSVSWGKGGDFYYLRGAVLFRVRGAELFARSLYADFLEIGAAAGKIPFEFDPAFDNFWIAPDAHSLLLSKGRRALFYFPLNAEAETSELLLPYLLLPRSLTGLDVLWPQDGTVTVLAAAPSENGAKTSAWRLNLSGKAGAAFEPLPPPGRGSMSGRFSSGLLSPDGSLAVFWGTGGILLYDYVNWRLLDVLDVRPASACLWAGNNELITGDDQKTERVRFAVTKTEQGTIGASVSGRELVCLSRPGEFGFEEGTFRILAKSGGSWFVSDGKTPWAEIVNPKLKPASQVSSQYRVYLEKQEHGFCENIPMIRNTVSVGTFPLIPSLYGVFPGRKTAAVCFDLYDDDSGLPEVLDALERRGIKATFFLNGEFIRRNPLAAADIAESGHEAASMFFAPVDLSDSRYRAGEEFVTRGLARNEDEYYRATGKELALLWHPPWYTMSPGLEAAAARAGYTAARRDIDPLDWVGREEEKLGIAGRTASETIDFIMEQVKTGSVIPVRLGLLPGGRNDYLFKRVNVLLDALIREGYTLTTVSGIF